MEKEPICVQCGKENNIDSKYCSTCGAPLDIEDNEIKESVNPTNNHGGKIVIGYILSFLFVPVGLVIGLFLITQKSESAKKNGWIIFGIAFTIVSIIIFALLMDINSNLSSIHWQLYDIYYRMGQMRLY